MHVCQMLIGCICMKFNTTRLVNMHLGVIHVYCMTGLSRIAVIS